MTRYGRAFEAILVRDARRLLRQRERLAAIFLRPLVWLVFFAAGFRGALGLSITQPYETYILYAVYIVPGLAGMMLLFNGIQSSLAMVYDRELGSIRALLSSPVPKPLLLMFRLLSAQLLITGPVLIFLLVARLWDVRPPLLGYLAVVPAVLASGLMLGALGLIVASVSRQLENFAAAMNFVIFPLFFASTALYPLWRLNEANGTLALLARLNPFSHAVELLRFALYLKLNLPSLAVVLGIGAASFLVAVCLHEPRLLRHKLKGISLLRN